MLPKSTCFFEHIISWSIMTYVYMGCLLVNILLSFIYLKMICSFSLQLIFKKN